VLNVLSPFSHDWPHNSWPINCHIISFYSFTTATLLPSLPTTTLLQPTTRPDVPRMARTWPTICHIAQPMCYTLSMTQWDWKPVKQGHRRAEGEAGAVRGTPYTSNARPSSASASDSRLPSAPAPATSSLFHNAFGRMTSYATRSRPASTPDHMMSQDSSSRPDISSNPSVYDTLTRHVCCTLHIFPNFGLISYIHYFVY